MDSRTMTNTLLLFVVLCLALIVVKMYKIGSTAEAAGVQATASTSTAMLGCYMQFGSCEWRFIRVTDDGFLAAVTGK
jgi:hypothetical protein